MHKYCSSVFNVLEKLSHTLIRTRQIYESLSVLISLSVFVSININRIRVLLVYRNHKKSEAKRALRIATKFALKYPETWFVFCLNFMIFKTLIREQFNLVGADVLAFSPVLKLKQAFFLHCVLSLLTGLPQPSFCKMKLATQRNKFNISSAVYLGQTCTALQKNELHVKKFN